MVSGRQRNWKNEAGSRVRECGAGEVVYSVVTENQRLLVLEGSDRCVFLLLEYDFHLTNQTRVDFALQIHSFISIRLLDRFGRNQSSVR